MSVTTKNKAANLDDINMKSYIYGCNRLYIHISLLFNLFIKYCYVPGPFSSSVIVPLVKCKTKNLSDVENYRAIAISNSISKLFESVILNEINR